MSACATRPPTLQPFSTDGCTLFPDRSPTSPADWCGCCVEHDLAYWRGGTEAERLAADRRLEECVRSVTGDPALARTMLRGVRVGGSPYLHTPFRWAYGWPQERNYEPLTPAESARADQLEARFRAERPARDCEPAR